MFILICSCVDKTAQTEQNQLKNFLCRKKWKVVFNHQHRWYIYPIQFYYYLTSAYKTALTLTAVYSIPHAAQFQFILNISDPQTKSRRFLYVCGNKWWCEMNGKRDSLMIMRRLIFLEYPVRAQPIGCQIKAPVSMTKCCPFAAIPANIY